MVGYGMEELKQIYDYSVETQVPPVQLWKRFT